MDLNRSFDLSYRIFYMTEFENHEPETKMWIYMTDLPADYTESDLQVIFNRLGNDQLIIKEVRFVPCFRNPYQAKSAYILFYSWFTCSKDVSAIESCFLNRTYYTYHHQENRSWFEYFSGKDPIEKIYKIYYSKKGLSYKICARKWNLIKTHFQKIEKNENIMGELLAKINCLEERLFRLERRIGFSEEEDYVDL